MSEATRMLAGVRREEIAMVDKAEALRLLASIESEVIRTPIHECRCRGDCDGDCQRDQWAEVRRRLREVRTVKRYVENQP